MAKKKKEEKRPEPFETESELFSSLYSMVEDAKGSGATWRDNTDTYYRLRMRHKKTKSFPFPGCSNLRLPTIETYIRKAKAALVGIYANIKPRMMVVPQSDSNLEKARRIEKFLDWLCDVKINLLQKLVVIADIMLERGFCLAKPIWRMEDNPYTETISIDDFSSQEITALFDPNVSDEMIIEYMTKKLNIDTSETVVADNIDALQGAIDDFRKGKQKATLHLKDEIYNAPDVIIADPVFVGVPGDSGRDPQQTRLMYHEYFEPYDSLKRKADMGIIDKEALENINFIKETNLEDISLIVNTKDTQEGIDRLNNPSKLVKVIDLYCYYDLDKQAGEDDENKEELNLSKCHFLLAPDFAQVLKKQRLENDSQKFPFVRFDAEIIDDRWYSSRGYPQHLEDLSKEIDAQHNQKIDNQTIRNAPMFVFRSGIVNPHLVKFIPGQGIPVPGMTPLEDAIQVLNNTNPNAEFSYEREELLLKSVIQEYLGQIDYSVQSMINKRQPRTLGEVQMQAQSANTVFSLDVALFASALSELFTQLLELCQQYMPERIFTLVTGDNGIEPLHLTRDEIQGKYFVICRGNELNSNPQLRAQKSLMKAQLLLNPLTLQLGVVQPMNAYNILKRYLQDDGELGWKELISPPRPQMPPPAATIIKPTFEELTDNEQAQVLAGIGIKPDVMGRSLKSGAIVQEKASEQRAEAVDSGAKVLKVIGDQINASKKEEGSKKE